MRIHITTRRQRLAKLDEQLLKEEEKRDIATRNYRREETSGGQTRYFHQLSDAMDRTSELNAQRWKVQSEPIGFRITLGRGKERA